MAKKPSSIKASNGKIIRYYQDLYVALTEEYDYDTNLRKSIKGDNLLGFMTYVDGSEGARKCKVTADDWAERSRPYVRGPDGYYVVDPNATTNWDKHLRHDPIPPLQLKNIPRTGFKFMNMVRRLDTSNVVWRVLDPAGFELEVSSNNLSDIIFECGIQKDGIIDRPCIWARQAAYNILVPEGTEYWACYRP